MWRLCHLSGPVMELGQNEGALAAIEAGVCAATSQTAASAAITSERAGNHSH